MMREEKSEGMRDYGMGDSTQYVTEPPVLLVSTPLDTPCENCKGRTLFTIRVGVKHPQLRGTNQTGVYVGCAACPYASPMVMASVD